uniref:Uncharacterized protein n=1 Tax=Wuchereria bancrofti TaxID=6293 RepID=A0AAF5PJC1_WUCBA
MTPPTSLPRTSRHRAAQEVRTVTRMERFVKYCPVYTLLLHFSVCTFINAWLRLIHVIAFTLTSECTPNTIIMPLHLSPVQVFATPHDIHWSVIIRLVKTLDSKAIQRILTLVKKKILTSFTNDQR